VTTIELAAGRETYPYHIGEGALGRVHDLMRPFAASARVFVVSDSNVGPLYGSSVAASLSAPYLELPAGEQHKQLSSVERVVRWLVANEADRQSLVVAVGGGVVTDIVGFAAAVTLRGMRWLAVPTTLLAMVDAAIGGKTGVDLDLGKNLVGAFWLPRAVIADPLTLTTLDQRQLRAGLAEVVKTAMIAPASVTDVLDSNLGSVVGGDPARALELITACVRVKGEIVALDERETGPRKALNLGHTLGHALEAATSYGRFLHGEAVSWGLLAALRLARDRGLLATAEAEAWAARIEQLSPLPGLAGLRWETVVRFMAHDKKRGARRIGWVLPRLGGVVLDVPVAHEEAENVFSLLCVLHSEGPFFNLF